jgi:hypothetical protein
MSKKPTITSPQNSLTKFVKGEISSMPKTFTVPQNPTMVATDNALETSFALSSVGISGRPSNRSPLVLVTPSGHLTLDEREVGKEVMSVCKLPKRMIPPFRAPKDRTFDTTLVSCDVTAAYFSSKQKDNILGRHRPHNKNK